MNSTCIQLTNSSTSSCKFFAPNPMRRSGCYCMSKLKDQIPKYPFSLSSECKSNSLFDLGSIDEIAKDFQTFKSDSFQAQREILSILITSSNDNFFYDDLDAPIPAPVKNPFYKNFP